MKEFDHEEDTVKVVGVGLGPFNLGLAALLQPIDDEVEATFFDRSPAFAWHPGMMVPGAALQVPFLADLVTLADPTSPFSFLNYLHCRNRLYRFYFYERFHVPRREYDAYCRWVADQLPSCRFGQRVLSVDVGHHDSWLVRTQPIGGPVAAVAEHRADAVVLGVGSTPWVPPVAEPALGPTVFHSAGYMARRADVLAGGDVTVVGSGQSAAEIVADLLAAASGPDGHPLRLRWFTRGRGFLPMEYSKLGLEHFTTEYTRFFHGLPEERRDRLREGQDLLYKGISADTSAEIYDLLYEATIDGGDAPDRPGVVTPSGLDVAYASACELRALDARAEGWRLRLHHLDEDVEVDHTSRHVILATGYRPAPLPLADGLAELVERDGQGRPVVDLDHRVRLPSRPKALLFTQNAELHTHGVGTPDLGLGARRSATVVNSLIGREVYPDRPNTVFQTFGAPEGDPS